MFTTGYFVMCLLFFVPYVSTMCGSLVMWFLPLACIIPFAVMPLFYMLVHRFDTLLFGRYHLVMPVSGFIAALFFVVAWSGNGTPVTSACLVFFGAVIFVTAVLLYRYCAFSVRARLLGEDVTAASPWSIAFTLAGGVAAIAVFIAFLRYDSATARINTAYVLAGVCCVLTIVQYLSTYYSIPRLTGKRVMTVKNVYRSFFSGLELRTYVSALLFGGAFATVTALDMYLIATGENALSRVGIAAIVFVCCYAVAQLLCVTFVKRRSIALSAVNLVVFCLSGVALILVAALSLSGKAFDACTLGIAGLAGLGGAITTRQTKLRFLTIKPRVTSGVVFILLELTECASASIALFCCTAVETAFVATNTLWSFVGGGALVLALAIAAFVCAGKRRVHRDDAPALELEPDGEILQGIVQDEEARDNGVSDGSMPDADERQTADEHSDAENPVADSETTEKEVGEDEK